MDLWDTRCHHQLPGLIVQKCRNNAGKSERKIERSCVATGQTWNHSFHGWLWIDQLWFHSLMDFYFPHDYGWCIILKNNFGFACHDDITSGLILGFWDAKPVMRCRHGTRGTVQMGRHGLRCRHLMAPAVCLGWRKWSPHGLMFVNDLEIHSSINSHCTCALPRSFEVSKSFY